MKRLLLLGLLLVATLGSVTAQNCDTKCNLIQNSCFEKSVKKNKIGKIAVQNNRLIPWQRTHGSPQYNPSPAITQPGSVTLVSLANGSKKVTNVSEGFAQSVSVIKDKPYILGVNYQRGNSNTVGEENFLIELTDVLPSNGYPTRNGNPTVLPSNYTSKQTLINKTAANAVWTLETACFNANESYHAIWIYSKPGVTLLKKDHLITHFDDFELIENFDFVLRDTSICQPGTSVGLSTKCDSFLNFTASCITYWKTEQ